MFRFRNNNSLSEVKDLLINFKESNELFFVVRIVNTAPLLNSFICIVFCIRLSYRFSTNKNVKLSSLLI